MRFRGLDLNLLAALDVLLDERSVSRAAERLHLSQPSLSAALARLREYFDDPLLELQGKQMILTPLAVRLRPQLSELLASVDRTLAQARGFDPSTSSRWFRVAVSDYLVAVLFPQVAQLLNERGPQIRLELRAPSEATQALLEQGEIDLLLTPELHCVRDHPTELLFEERFVVVGWSESRLMREPLTEDVFYSAGHVAAALGEVNRGSFVDDLLRARGRERRVEIVAYSFTQVAGLLAGTERLAVMHERLARTLSGRYPLRICEPPFPLQPMREMIQCHRTRTADAGLQWLMAVIHEAAKADR
jgi:LysR family transcriptional regulator, nod-box dependent transcriptional activator